MGPTENSAYLKTARRGNGSQQHCLPYQWFGQSSAGGWEKERGKERGKEREKGIAARARKLIDDWLEGNKEQELMMEAVQGD